MAFWKSHPDSIAASAPYPNELLDYLAAEENRLVKLCKTVPSGVVLEAGCGRGRIIGKILPHCKKVVGMDYSPALVKACLKRFRSEKKATVLERNISSTGFPDNHFDIAILAFNTLGNTDTDKEKILLELKRVLKINGRLAISVYSENAIRVQRKTYRSLGLNVAKEENGRIYTREGLVSQRFSKPELEAWLRVCGLNGDVEPLTSIGYFAVARKREGNETCRKYPY